MRNVKLANGLLWVVNALLGAGIVVFAFQYLLFPAESGLDPNFAQDEASTHRPTNVAPVSDQILKALRNPVTPASAPGLGPASSFRATLKGTVPSAKDPKQGAAFLKSNTRNLELVAYMGEAIEFDGKPYDEYAGWVLKEVYKDSAVFSNGIEKAVLPLDTGASPGTPGGAAGPAGGPPGVRVNRAGQPYSGQNFRSQLLQQSDTRHVWGIDVAEIDWALQNQDRIMDSDFQVSPNPGGGVRVEGLQAGSIGALRGIMQGDIIRDVNGVALNSLADAKTLMGNPAMRQQSGLRLVVERAGKTIALEYRPIR